MAPTIEGEQTARPPRFGKRRRRAVRMAFGLAGAVVLSTLAAPVHGAAVDLPVSFSAITTPYGVEAALPPTVIVRDGSGGHAAQAVTWDPVDRSVYSDPGDHAVHGELADGAPVDGIIRVGAKDRQLKIAAVGDSITWGWGTSGSATNSYPAELGQLLGPGYQVMNFGVVGATALAKGDGPYVRTSAYPASMASSPDAVLIQLGTNDSKPWNWLLKDQFAGDYAGLVRGYLELPSHPLVYVLLPPTVFGPNGAGIDENNLKDAISRTLGALSADDLRRVAVIDNHAATTGLSAQFPDTVHPNNEGALTLAVTVRTGLAGLPTPRRDDKVLVSTLTGQSGMFLHPVSFDESGLSALRSMGNGDWVRFRHDFGTGCCKAVQVRAATGFGDTDLVLRADAPDGAEIASMRLANTGGLTGWRTQSVMLSAELSGVHDVYLSVRRTNTPADWEIASLVWVAFPTQNGVPLAPGWQTVRPSSMDRSQQSDGAIALTALYGDLFGGYNNARNLVLRDLGLRDVTTTVQLSYSPTASSSGAGLIVYWDDDNYAEVVSAGGSRLVLRNEESGNYGEVSAQVAVSGPVLLKLERVGGRITGFYSTDGVAWNTIGQVMNANLATSVELKIGIVAHKGVNSDPDVAATFRDFTVDGQEEPFFP